MKGRRPVDTRTMSASISEAAPSLTASYLSVTRSPLISVPVTFCPSLKSRPCFCTSSCSVACTVGKGGCGAYCRCSVGNTLCPAVVHLFRSQCPTLPLQPSGSLKRDRLIYDVDDDAVKSNPASLFDTELSRDCGLPQLT